MNSDMKLYALLLVYVTMVMLWVSIDSPMHDLHSRCDSAYFFICGKAVMNGLTPYVDFADSKGPLLWLIYGIGYLLSPRNYVGVWLLSLLCYALTLLYNYKTARVLLGDERKSLLVALLMPLAYFMPWFHFEVRAEDFCHLPVAISMYYLFRLLYEGSGNAAAQQTLSVKRCGLVLGGCFMALVLVKYSIAVMQGSMIAIALWYLIWVRSEYGMVKWLFAGMGIVALPFVLWMVLAGSWSAFIAEYFVNTFKTVSSDKGFVSALWDEFEKQWSSSKPHGLLLLLLLGCWLLSRELKSYRYVPMAVCLFFFLVCTRHNLNYYYKACYDFLIFLIIYIVSKIEKPVGTRGLLLAAAVVLVWSVSEVVREHNSTRLTMKWVEKSKDRDSFERISRCIQGDHPRILNLLHGEHGFGIECETLPAGKYWTKQAGATKEMMEGHLSLLSSGSADYVIAYDYKRCRKKKLTSRLVKSFGYEVCDSFSYVDYKNDRVTTVVYKKKRK